MITGMHHIAIISTKEENLTFYKTLGFREVERRDRGYDVIVFLEGYGITLEIFIDPKHPERVTGPEAKGLRHLALKVDNLEETIKHFDLDFEPVRDDRGKKMTFVKDPDGLPIEFHE